MTILLRYRKVSLCCSHLSTCFALLFASLLQSRNWTTSQGTHVGEKALCDSETPLQVKGATRSERNHGVKGIHKDKEAYKSEGANGEKAQVY